MGSLFQPGTRPGTGPGREAGRENVDPETLVVQARNSDENGKRVREYLLQKYTPFIMGVASRVSGRYLELGRDDEAGVGLRAFNEAIDTYDHGSGRNFLAFAEMVIRRRLYDFFRKRSRWSREVPLTHYDREDEDGNTYNYVDKESSYRAYAEAVEVEERRAEILELARELHNYGISFQDLARVCPKHEDARRRAVEAAREVAADPELLNYLRHRRTLPLKALEERVRVSRKTLERQRKYIIAATLVLAGDFQYLREYLSF